MRIFVNIIAIASIGFLGYAIVQMHGKTGRLAGELELLTAQLSVVEEENQQIEADIDYYSRPENLEKEARARLNLKKPGEQLIIVTPRRAPEDEAATTTPAAEPELSWWQRLIKFLDS